MNYSDPKLVQCTKDQCSNPLKMKAASLEGVLKVRDLLYGLKFYGPFVYLHCPDDDVAAD